MHVEPNGIVVYQSPVHTHTPNGGSRKILLRQHSLKTEQFKMGSASLGSATKRGKARRSDENPVGARSPQLKIAMRKLLHPTAAHSGAPTSQTYQEKPYAV